MSRLARICMWWLLFLFAAFVIWLLPWPPSGGPVAVRIEHLFPALMVAGVFFIVFLWPLLSAPGWSRAEEDRPTTASTLTHGLAEILLLPLLASPLMVFGSFLSDTPPRTVLLSAAMLIVLAAWVCGVGAALAGLRARSAYYLLLASLLSGVAPLAQYLSVELIGRDATWLRVVSPLWLMVGVAGGQPGRFVLGGAIFFGGAALVAMILSALWHGADDLRDLPRLSRPGRC